MSSKKTLFALMLETEEERHMSTSDLVTKHVIVKSLLDHVAIYSLKVCAAVELNCAECGETAHLTYQCKHSRVPMLSYYNSGKSNESLEAMEYVLLIGAGELLNILMDMKVRDLLLEGIYSLMLCLYKFYLNNFDDNALVDDYIEWIAATMEQDNLLQDSSINEEEEEHNEEEKERIDHPLTISTSNNEHIIDVSNFGNDSINAHVVENYSEEDSCLAFESIDIDELNMRLLKNAINILMRMHL